MHVFFFVTARSRAMCSHRGYDMVTLWLHHAYTDGSTRPQGNKGYTVVTPWIHRCCFALCIWICIWPLFTNNQMRAYTKCIGASSWYLFIDYSLLNTYTTTYTTTYTACVCIHICIYTWNLCKDPKQGFLSTIVMESLLSNLKWTSKHPLWMKFASIDWVLRPPN